MDSAAALLRQAADLGNAQARNNLALILMQAGSGGVRFPAKA